MSRPEKTATAATPAPTTSSAGNRPLRVFRARGVSCAVFENHATIEGRAVTFLKAELRRVYRDGDEFKTTHALSVSDVPVARLLLEQAFAFMLEASQSRDNMADGESDASETTGDGEPAPQRR